MLEAPHPGVIYDIFCHKLEKKKPRVVQTGLELSLQMADKLLIHLPLFQVLGSGITSM